MSNESVLLLADRIQGGQHFQNDGGELLDLDLRYVLLADGTLGGAVMIAEGGTLVFLGHDQYLIRMGHGLLALDLLNALRHDGLQQLAGLFPGKPQLFSDQLKFVFVLLGRSSAHISFSLQVRP